MSDLVVQKTDQNMPEVHLSRDEVKKFIAPNATDKELYMFMGIAQSYGLNPFKREIHFTKYGNSPGQVIVGYESYIKRAERTGQLDGWSVWFEKDDIGEKAVIEIHRKDRSHSFKWEVYRSEFDKQQSTWKAMPYFMLKKVAISQGFRLAFPEDLGGMPYTPDEINAGKSEDLPKDEVLEGEYQEAAPKPGPSVKTITKTQAKEISDKLDGIGVTEKTDKLNHVNQWLETKEQPQVKGVMELTRDQAMQLLDELTPETFDAQEAVNA